MRTRAFWAALDRLLAEAAEAPTAAMCSESLWWRCHRRLLADAAVLVPGGEGVHLDHPGGVLAPPPRPGAPAATATCWSTTSARRPRCPAGRVVGCEPASCRSTPAGGTCST